MAPKLRLVAPSTEKRTVSHATAGRRPNRDLRTREYLTEGEIERLLEAASATDTAIATQP